MESFEQLHKTYASMTDDELEALASDAYDLTSDAQRALRAALSKRGLSIELKSAPLKPEIKNPDLDLALITSVWDLDEARKVKTVLDAAGIHSYFGRNYIEDLGSLQGSFDDGVDVRVSCYAEDMARLVVAGVQKLDPKESDGPDDDDDVDVKNLAEDDAQYVHCPKCHSLEIVLEDLQGGPGNQGESLSKYDWRCDTCGHKWRDDGVEE